MAARSILPITDDDLPFVQEMLCEAAFWRDGSDGPPIDEALSQPGLAVYVAGWGRPGDAGRVARIDGEPAGAVWVRRFHDEQHGYGDVDAATRELSMAVVKNHRGRGIGRRLTTAMLTQLRLDAVGQVSLSVENDNPAYARYESLGFVPWRTVDGATTMRRTLP